MSFSLNEFLDVSQIQGQGITGSDLMNPISLAQKLGYSFLGTWALYSIGADEMIFNLMRSQLNVPENISAPLSAVALGAGADLIGGEIKRVVSNVTNM
jgi:hypothetical protein